MNRVRVEGDKRAMSGGKETLKRAVWKPVARIDT